MDEDEGINKVREAEAAVGGEKHGPADENRRDFQEPGEVVVGVDS